MVSQKSVVSLRYHHSLAWSVYFCKIFIYVIGGGVIWLQNLCSLWGCPDLGNWGYRLTSKFIQFLEVSGFRELGGCHLASKFIQFREVFETRNWPRRHIGSSWIPFGTWPPVRSMMRTEERTRVSWEFFCCHGRTWPCIPSRTAERLR